MPRPPPQPIFVYCGLEGGVTSCAVVSTADSAGILVGTSKGRCELYDADTHLLVRTVYVDDEKRAITSVGSIRNSLWVHVRNHAVIILGADDKPQTTMELSHCGYCRTIVVGRWLVYPDTNNEVHYTRFWSDSLQTPKAVQLKNLPLSITSVDEQIFIGDESGVVQQIYPSEGVVKEVSLFSEPVFSLASSSTLLACGSAKSPIVLLSVEDICGDRRKIDYPPSATGVGSLAFSTTGKTLTAGFWDGSVRAFSVQKLTILLYLDFHSETITQIQWSEVDGDERVVVASMDERLSLWKFK
ncbi:hypothetical protein Q1695_004152 [Nippostrongylus brasiliensis]|nr:hypothetical protein Q1695_004152 [Nippostrongylus brasiliensis]